MAARDESTSRLPAWASLVLGCPRCARRLTSEGPRVLRCASCGVFPVLGGVPILVPEPAAWCAEFHDAALASLAERGLCELDEVSTLEDFASAHPRATPSAFGDDWTLAESTGASGLGPAPVKGAGREPVAALLAAAAKSGPGAWLERRFGKSECAVEVGCGAGLRAEALAETTKHLVVVDLSLRAVLRTRLRAATEGGAQVLGVVGDAQHLPLRKASVDLLVAEHVVDLLDHPLAFFEGAAAALRPGGQALVTTPDPALGSGDDARAAALAGHAALDVKERADGLPWVRVNSSRFVESYLVQALRLSR